jgi:hypothetical protein
MTANGVHCREGLVQRANGLTIHIVVVGPSIALTVRHFAERERRHM